MAKAFCRVCGSSLFGGTWPDGREVSIRLGVLNGDPGIRPQYHSFVASKATWETLPDDGTPRHEQAKRKRMTSGRAAALGRRQIEPFSSCAPSAILGGCPRAGGSRRRNRGRAARATLRDESR